VELVVGILVGAVLLVVFVALAIAVLEHVWRR
jgi:hypothetical protein